MNLIQISILDILDITMVALLLSYLYRAIKGSSAYYIFGGIFFMYVLWLIVKMLNMKLMSLILGQIIGVGVIALIIVFQQEIRRFLIYVGNKYFKRIQSFKISSDNTTDVDEIVNACQKMSEEYTGALIVFARTDKLESIVRTGDVINGKVSQRLIETIFYRNTPLHDGAVIISDNKILAARCLLPITDNGAIPAYLGTRHRAAIGMTENSDAIVVVVSEQTGKISYVVNGQIERGLTIIQLKTKLITNV